jgi:hypothetical protein
MTPAKLLAWLKAALSRHRRRHRRYPESQADRADIARSLSTRLSRHLIKDVGGEDP